MFYGTIFFASGINKLQRVFFFLLQKNSHFRLFSMSCLLFLLKRLINSNVMHFVPHSTFSIARSVLYYWLFVMFNKRRRREESISTYFRSGLEFNAIWLHACLNFSISCRLASRCDQLLCNPRHVKTFIFFSFVQS